MGSFKIIIIGAGLAGTLLANGLLHKRIEVTVYERLPQDTNREGYQIRLGAPALEGFRTCLRVDQIVDLVHKFGRANGTKSAAPVVYDRHFRQLLDLTKFPSYSKSASINRVTLRDALAGPLSEAGILQYEKQFDRYSILNPGTSQECVRVWFTDGSSDDCSLLVGADGSHSKINKQLGLDNLQDLTTHMSVVTKTELKTKEFLNLSPGLVQYPVITFDSNKSIYFAAYLPDKLEVDSAQSQVEFDDNLSSCYFGMHIPTNHCPPNLAQLPREDKWDFISQSLRGWGKEYHEIVQLLRGSDVHVYRARASIRPQRQWRQKLQSTSKIDQAHPRVWLLGDAIHAMLPHRGMGGNQAMLDTAKLLPILVKLACAAQCGHELTTSHIAVACREYEDQMIPRAFEWVQKSGGMQMMPIDADTIFGKLVFFLLAQAIKVAVVWRWVVGPFTTKRYQDNAPELRT